MPRFKSSLRRLIEADRCFAEQSDANADVPVGWPEPGDHFLGFSLKRELGRGAFARVFLATEPALGHRLVAVKISLHGAAEARTLGRLVHPNVVPVYSVQKEELSGFTAICMPYLGSATLCDVLDQAFAHSGLARQASTILKAVQDGNEPIVNQQSTHYLFRHGTYVEGIRHIAAQLADALAFLHQIGICHRDLKPSNVLLTPTGRPVLLDFNLSFDALRVEQRFGGTLPYMAPEHLQAMGSATDMKGETGSPRSDLFAFGVLVYELLTGKHPFGPISLNGSALELRARLLERQRRGPTPLQKLNSVVPTAVAQVIERCLAYDPADRPASAAQAAAVLRPRWIWICLAGQLVGYHRLGLLLMTVILMILMGLPAAPAGLHSRFTGETEPLWQEGCKAYRCGLFDDAVRTFSQIVQADPTFSQAYYRRGRAYVQLGEWALAEADLQKADRLERDGRTKACLGYCRNALGKHGAAAFHYEDALRSGFVSAEVYNNLGYSYLESYGRLAKARANLDLALELNGRLQAAYYNRAVVELRKAEENVSYVPVIGFQSMRRAIQLGPRSPELFADAARLAIIQHERHGKVVSDTQKLFLAKEPLDYLQNALELGLDPRLLERDPSFRYLQQNPRFLELIHRSVPRSPVQEAIRILDPIDDLAQHP
jgi:serine/threonine protein kinase/Tfp pilus assembly protein PilF